MKYAVKNGFDVNQPINKEDTPLTLAIARSHSDVAKYVIENGADVIQCDQNRNMSGWVLPK